MARREQPRSPVSRTTARGIELHPLLDAPITASTWPARKDDPAAADLQPLCRRRRPRHRRPHQSCGQRSDTRRRRPEHPVAHRSIVRPVRRNGEPVGRPGGQPRLPRYEERRGVLGDAFIDPNSRTVAQGRTFTERGDTIKTAGKRILRSRHLRRGHGTIRGRPALRASRSFAPDLTQGPELVRAFRNGKTRFTYTMTVDARLQKGFTVNGYRVAAIPRCVQPVQPAHRDRRILRSRARCRGRRPPSSRRGRYTLE